MTQVISRDRQKTRSLKALLRLLSTPVIRALATVVIGSLLLRLASHTTGEMLQFYFERIDVTKYPLSHGTRGFITASFFVAELFGSLAFGALSDRYGRRLFILLGPIFGLVAVQLTSMTIVIWVLVITRLLEGLSTASSVPATLGFISEATVARPNLRARVIGLFELTLVGGIALGASVGGYLWKYFQEPRSVLGVHLASPAFSLNGLIYIASLAVFAWGLRDVRPADDSARARAAHRLSHYTRLLKSRTAWAFIPAWVSIFSIVGMWINSSLGLFTGNRHFRGQFLTGTITPASFGNGFAALAIFFAAGVLAWSFVLGRYRKTSVMLVATLALFAMVLTVFGLNHLESFKSVYYYLLLGSLLVELLILSGFTPAALTYLADITEGYSEDRGSIMGLYSVFLGVGQFLGITAGGYFAEWNGIDGLLLLTTVFGSITAIGLFLLRRREQVPAVSASLPARSHT